MNLISNAYHAVEITGGEIHVKLYEKDCDSATLNGTQLKAGRYVVFRVSDNGCGIDPLAMGKIFEPYFSTKEKGKGTGLGLSVVYGIAKEHQGDITVESKVNKGATFNLFFPVAAQGVLPEMESPEQTQLIQTGNERILLVDDEISIVRLEKQILERLGYQVAERTSSVDALNTFKETPFLFDLVISDITMPHMTGDQLALKINEIRPDIPIIFCTGFSNNMDKMKIDTPYIKQILMKPVGIFDLANTVRNVVVLFAYCCG